MADSSRVRTLMTVNGHPDDETVTAGGVMARYAAEGVRVVCVVATRGELGEIVDPTLDTPANHARLGSIREGELQQALAELNPAIEHVFLGYRDSGMIGQPSNSDPESFWSADVDEATGRLVKVVRETRPDVMVGPNHFGNDGHPDHIRAAQIAALAFERAGDTTCYPEQLADGRSVWAPSKLYESVDQLGRGAKVRRALATGGVRSLVSMSFRVLRHWTPQAERKRKRMAAEQGAVTTSVDVAAYMPNKFRALQAHRSQIRPDSDRFALTAEERAKINPTEDFTLSASRVASSIPEQDLFAGIEEGH
jgi:LmbE family N-acetylglucosaminyl deacetylase